MNTKYTYVAWGWKSIYPGREIWQRMSRIWVIKAEESRVDDEYEWVVNVPCLEQKERRL